MMLALAYLNLICVRACLDSISYDMGICQYWSFTTTRIICLNNVSSFC